MALTAGPASPLPDANAANASGASASSGGNGTDPAAIVKSLVGTRPQPDAPLRLPPQVPAALASTLAVGLTGEPVRTAVASVLGVVTPEFAPSVHTVSFRSNSSGAAPPVGPILAAIVSSGCLDPPAGQDAAIGPAPNTPSPDATGSVSVGDFLPVQGASTGSAASFLPVPQFHWPWSEAPADPIGPDADGSLLLSLGPSTNSLTIMFGPGQDAAQPPQAWDSFAIAADPPPSGPIFKVPSPPG